MFGESLIEKAADEVRAPCGIVALWSVDLPGEDETHHRTRKMH